MPFSGNMAIECGRWRWARDDEKQALVSSLVAQYSAFGWKGVKENPEGRQRLELNSRPRLPGVNRNQSFRLG